MSDAVVRERRRNLCRHRRPRFDASLPTVVLLHGAGFDHTTWALHSRWFAHHGFGVLAPDLPGHGRSSGAPLTTIADMADWTAALLDAAGIAKARLVGHSMGSLIALETAARHPATGFGAQPDRHGGGHDGRTRSAQGRGGQRSRGHRHGLDLGSRLFRPNWAAASRRACGCTAARSACSNNAGRACCSATCPPATPTRMRLTPRRRSPCPTTLILGERDMMTPREVRQGARRSPAEFTHGRDSRRGPHDDDGAARRTARSVAGLKLVRCCAGWAKARACAVPTIIFNLGTMVGTLNGTRICAARWVCPPYGFARRHSGMRRLAQARNP